MLLVRLDKVDTKRARALIEESYRLRAASSNKAKRKVAGAKPTAAAKKRKPERG
jgi:hypothetical protein